MSSMLLHVDPSVLSNTLLPVASNQPSGIWISSQCPSIEDCAAHFENVDVTNTVGTAKLVSPLYYYYLSLNHTPKVLTV